MNALQSVPANVRTALYWIGYVLGMVSLGIATVWGIVAAANPDVTMPLWLLITSALIGLAQTQLNLLAGSNVTDPRTISVQAPEHAETTITADVTVQTPTPPNHDA